jgi:hypothetical protein
MPTFLTLKTKYCNIILKLTTALKQQGLNLSEIYWRLEQIMVALAYIVYKKTAHKMNLVRFNQEPK